MSKKIINNLEAIKKIICFPTGNTDVYYFIQVIQRKKENPDLGVSEIKRHSVWIESLDDLDTRLPRIQGICSKYNARAYISCIPRSKERFTKECLLEFSLRVCSGSYDKPWNIPDKVAQRRCTIKTKGVISKTLWLLDVDDTSEAVLEKVREYIKKFTIPITTLPSPNGYHIVIEAFNISKLKDICVSRSRNDFMLPGGEKFTLLQECNTILYSESE